MWIEDISGSTEEFQPMSYFLVAPITRDDEVLLEDTWAESAMPGVSGASSAVDGYFKAFIWYVYSI